MFFLELPHEGLKYARELGIGRVKIKVNDTDRADRVDRREVQEKVVSSTVKKRGGSRRTRDKGCQDAGKDRKC